jgi:V/A-type H+-transporting ATPase subunit B
VLSADIFARRVYPPIDALSSLSRLMRRGAGPGRTRDDHLAISAQVLALLARARQAEELGALIGIDALSMTEQRYLEFAHRFEADFLNQSKHESRELDDTLDRAWEIAATLPTNELTMVSTEQIQAHAATAAFEPEEQHDDN